MSYRDTGTGEVDLSVEVSDPCPATSASLRHDFARAKVPIRNLELLCDIHSAAQPPYPLRGSITKPAALSSVTPNSPGVTDTASR
jgi:hypothetical protein